MSRSVYNIGTEVTIRAVFKDPDTKAVVEPSSVTCTVVDGEDTVTHPTVTKTQGVYEATLDIDNKGYWRYAFAGTGGFKARAESWFFVRPQLVP